jgi:hypothetical protein
MISENIAIAHGISGTDHHIFYKNLPKTNIQKKILFGHLHNYAKEI